MQSVAALALLLQLLLAAPAGEAPVEARQGPAGAALHFEERAIAGGPDDFMLVKHLVLRGSNFDIGWKLAEIARNGHGATLAAASPDTALPAPAPTGGAATASALKLRVLRRYLARSFPIHHERMRGVAAFFHLDPEGDNVDFSGLFYNLGHLGPDAGCSVVFYPPAFTATGMGVLSRNYDFSTGTLDGRPPPPGQPAATSRPYVLELYPDQGYASLAVCAYDLVGGVIDGINSEGLCVALLADDESAATRPIEPAMGTEVGLYELNIPRFLLDNCATCEEAKEMLLSAKHYYSFMPLHYIIADRYSNSFVWEYSYSSNKEYVIEGAGKPQVVTNHPLYRQPGEDAPPPAAGAPIDSHTRHETLTRRIELHEGRCSLEFIKETNAGVAPRDPSPAPPGGALHRTLWHALYYPEERRAEIDFYLGDKPDPEKPGLTRIARSGYLEFQLDSRP